MDPKFPDCKVPDFQISRNLAGARMDQGREGIRVGQMQYNNSKTGPAVQCARLTCKVPGNWSDKLKIIPTRPHPVLRLRGHFRMWMHHVWVRRSLEMTDFNMSAYLSTWNHFRSNPIDFKISRYYRTCSRRFSPWKMTPWISGSPPSTKHSEGCFFLETGPWYFWKSSSTTGHAQGCFIC